jgi:hypothetical protein
LCNIIVFEATLLGHWEVLQFFWIFSYQFWSKQKEVFNSFVLAARGLIVQQGVYPGISLNYWHCFDGNKLFPRLQSQFSTMKPKMEVVRLFDSGSLWVNCKQSVALKDLPSHHISM